MEFEERSVKSKQNYKIINVIREESEILKRSVDDIKEKIKLLTPKNKDIAERIKHLEDDSDRESDMDGFCFEDEQQKVSTDFKWFI